MKFINDDNWKGVAGLMLSSAGKLQSAGADFLICPDNTIHQSFEQVAKSSPLPWLHIADEVAAEAEASGYRKLLVLGTRFLMEGPVYPASLGKRNIEFSVPGPGQRKKINEIIFNELVYGNFRSDSKRYFLSVINEYRTEGCDAAILGCTEIPLIVLPEDSPLPVLDSTRILARAALKHSLGTGRQV